MLLKDKLTINGMELNNRLVMPPMATYMTESDGLVTKPLCDYYKARALGGYNGMIITEHFYICPQGIAGKGQVSIADDSVIEAMKALTDAIHQDGTKAICQINHAGSATNAAVTGQPIVGPSPVPCPGRKKELESPELPLELSVEEIQELEEAYVAAALRAKAAGYDGVEIHSAHGYLMNQFFSPLTNKRHDAYGVDSVENRVRFQVETIKKVRAAVGDDYPVLIRLGGCDYMEGGSLIEEAVEACKLFEAAGVDAIDLTGGMCRFMRSDNKEPGYFSDLSSAVKAEVKVPVILAGGIKTAEQAEALLAAGAADLIGVARMQLADARWAEKAMTTEE